MFSYREIQMLTPIFTRARVYFRAKDHFRVSLFKEKRKEKRIILFYTFCFSRRQYTYYLIARKDIVHYTRLAAISLVFFLSPSTFTVARLPVPCLSLFPSVTPAPFFYRCLRLVFRDSLVCLLLLEQFGQNRKGDIKREVLYADIGF